MQAEWLDCSSRLWPENRGFHRRLVMKKQSGAKRYAVNIYWMVLDKVLRIIAVLSVGIWMARYLGPKEFGDLNYAQSIVGLFGSFTALGLDSIVVREMLRNPTREQDILWNAFYLKLFASILLCCILSLYLNIKLESDDIRNLIFIFAIAYPFQSVGVVSLYFQAKVQNRGVALSNIVSFTVSNIAKVYFILKRMPLVAFAWTQPLEGICLAAALAFVYRKAKGSTASFFHRFDISMAKFLLKESWPLMFSGVVIAIYMRIDQVMIMSLVGAQAVGQYSAAVRISEGWYFVPMIITSTLFPAVIKAKEQGEEIYRVRVQALYNVLFWFAVGVAAVMTFMSRWAVNVLYGSAYADAGNILMIHIWAGVFVSMGYVNNKWHYAENLQQYLLLNTFLGALINIALNIMLIPKLEGIGAAIATLISYSVVVYFMMFVRHKTAAHMWNITLGLFDFNKLKWIK